MEPGAAIAVLVVLAIAIAAIVYVVRHQAACPAAPAAVSFWATPDRAGVPTNIGCPAGSVISVQDADYGAPWDQCAWADVTARAGSLMDGGASYSLPAGSDLSSLLGSDPCPGTAKTFAGAYTCVAPQARAGRGGQKD